MTSGSNFNIDNYFEHTLGDDFIIRRGAQVWLRDEAYTAPKDQLKEPFSNKQYKEDKNRHLFFHWIDDQFLCANPLCGSEDIVCIWYEYNGIAMGVDDSFGEFYCDKCGKYTFVEYNRDTS